MSLDLSQNITLYLSLITSLVSVILLLYISKQNNVIRKISKTLNRLKYEVDKVQQADNKIIKQLTTETTTESWIEEDETKKRLKKEKKAAKKENKKRLSDLFPKNLEYILGVKVWDKIGIGGFLIGVALFINISMEMEWINSFGRLFFGIILTLIFLVGGYLLRKKFFHFSNILLSGGIAALIFTFFASYYQYHLISLIVWVLSTTFVITSTIIIAIAVKRHEIVIITFIAAYIAPFTVKFVGTDYLILFSYITLLNIGIIIYDYYQKSIIVNLISFGFTFMIYNIWLISKIYFYHEPVPYLGAFLFLTLFYILFFLMVMVNNIRENKKFHKMDFSVFMTAKGIYFGAGMMIINTAGVDYHGLFVGLIGIINYIYFLVLYKRKNFDRRILNIFLSLSIMFFSLIIPIEFYGKTVTMVWGFQSVVLMFVVLKANHKGMRFSSFMLTIGMVASLFVDMYKQYVSTTADLEYIKPIFNQSFLSGMIALSALTATIIMLPKTKGDFFVGKFLKKNIYQIILIIFSALIFYTLFLFEIRYATLQNYDNHDLVDTFTSIYNLGFLFILSVVTLFINKKPFGIISIAVAFLSSILYIGFYSGTYVTVRDELLLGAAIQQWQYNLHYIGSILLSISLIAALKNIKQIQFKNNLISYLITYILIFCFVYVVSAETTQVFTTQLYEPHILIQNIIHDLYRFAYSIAWGISALILTVLGFLFNIKQLRIAGMSLYFTTFFKIVLYDIWTITNQELMILFITMGVILLIISFLFQYTNKLNPQVITNKNIKI